MTAGPRAWPGNKQIGLNMYCQSLSEGTLLMRFGFRGWLLGAVGGSPSERGCNIHEFQTKVYDCGGGISIHVLSAASGASFC